MNPGGSLGTSTSQCKSGGAFKLACPYARRLSTEAKLVMGPRRRMKRATTLTALVASSMSGQQSFVFSPSPSLAHVCPLPLGFPPFSLLLLHSSLASSLPPKQEMCERTHTSIRVVRESMKVCKYPYVSKQCPADGVWKIW